MPENAGKRFLYSPSKLELVVLVSTLISAITAGAISVIMPIIFSLLAKTFLTETNDSHSFLSKVNQLSTYFVYLGVAAFFANFITTAGFIYLGHKITRRLREYYLAALLYQNAAFFDGFGPGECAARLTSQTDTVEKAIAQKSARDADRDLTIRCLLLGWLLFLLEADISTDLVHLCCIFCYEGRCTCDNSE